MAEVEEWLRSGRLSISDVDAREETITYHNGRSRVRIDQLGMNALHYAALYSKIDIVKFLIKNGAGKSKEFIYYTHHA